MPDVTPQPTAPAAGQPAGGEPTVATADTKAYLQYFPEAIRSEKTLEKFSGKDANEVLGKVATSYVNLEKHAGSMIRIPGEKATAEERAAFNEKLGVPKDPAGYEIKDIRNGDKVLVPEAETAAFLSWAHGQGLTKTQARAVVDRFVQYTQFQADTNSQKTAESAEEAYNTIRADWGSLTDRNVALVQRAIGEFGDDETRAGVDETGVGNAPWFLKFVHAMASPMLEDGLIKGENLGMKQADAQAEIQKLMASEEYQGKKGRAEQVAVVEKIRALSAVAHAA